MSNVMYTREIMNREGVRLVANIVSQNIKRALAADEIRSLYTFIENGRTANWRNYTRDEIVRALAAAYVARNYTAAGRKREASDRSVIDIHEIMKRGIGTDQDQESDYEAFDNVNANGDPMRAVAVASGSAGASGDESTTIAKIHSIDTLARVTAVDNVRGILGKTDDVALQQMLNPQASWRKNYILLDSRYKNGNTDGVTSMQWSFLANTATNTSGGVNSLGDVQQIVAISCPALRIPYVDSIATNSYRRVTLLLNELSGQSYIGQEGRRFHFIFEATVDGNMIDLAPIQDVQATFEFAKPVTQLDTLTISFGGPLETVTFDQDNALMQIGYTNPATLTSTAAHNLRTGDQVYIQNFSTNAPVTDATAIANANRTQGYNVQVTDQYTIQLPDLDLSTVTAPITPLSVPVYFGSKRIFVPLEIKYIAKQTTTRL